MKKSIKDYEREATKVGKCLVHPVRGAARHLYALRHGAIKAGLRVRHACGNARCILAKHLKTEPAKKSVKAYELEAVKVGKCLVHPNVLSLARKVYQLRHGKITSSKILVCHTCDNPQCIRDSHHFLGSNLDNMQDMTRKGRRVAAMLRPEVRALQSKVQRARFEGPNGAAARAIYVAVFNRPAIKAKRIAAQQRRRAREVEMKKKGVK